MSRALLHPLAGLLLVLLGPVLGPAPATAELRLQPLPEAPSPAVPPLPLLEPYTRAAVLARMPAVAPGRTRLIEVAEADLIDGRLPPELARRQGREPALAVGLVDGVFDLASLAEAVDDADILARHGERFHAKAPILVGPRATLIVGRGATLRLLTARGAFLASAGDLYVVDATVTSWDADAGRPSLLERDEDFRPFLVGYSGSRTFVAGSLIDHLGFDFAKSQGLTFTTGPGDDAPGPAPTGWVVESTIRGNFYGFYTWEAEDVVVVGNRVVDSVLYGLDPHDHTTRLIIAKNEVLGTQRRHGIVASREVREALIFDNVVRDNGGSGIMLDRLSTDGVIARNRVLDNLDDGIVLYESPGNLIAHNEVTGNGRVGIRIRNSWQARVLGNRIVRNGGHGIEVYGRPIEPEEGRDYELDPYRTLVTATLAGNRLGANGGDTILMRGATRIDLHDLVRDESPEAADPRPWPRFGGDLEAVAADLSTRLKVEREGVRIVGPTPGDPRMAPIPLPPAAWRVTRPGEVLIDREARRAELLAASEEERRALCAGDGTPMAAAARALAFAGPEAREMVAHHLRQLAEAPAVAGEPDLLPAMVAYALIRDRLDPETREGIEVGLSLAMRRRGEAPAETAPGRGSPPGHALDVAWGALGGDDATFQRGIAGLLRTLAEDGAAADAVASLVAIAEMAAVQGYDLYAVEVDGRSLHDVVASRPVRDDGLAWAEAYVARFPDRDASRRLARRLGGEPLLDPRVGGAATCFFRPPGSPG
jgi:mannuronan 5-epimerase